MLSQYTCLSLKTGEKVSTNRRDKMPNPITSRHLFSLPQHLMCLIKDDSDAYAGDGFASASIWLNRMMDSSILIVSC
ncbi:hypothetical protein V6N12_040116 [Hibiscus sabdariffa]|uniref:Uncharacterized protein n=1 Tax=Hibiscus sabdariffa TaxID=183260 RepID=A0ABR2E2R2_9ROSI